MDKMVKVTAGIREGQGGRTPVRNALDNTGGDKCCEENKQAAVRATRRGHGPPGGDTLRSLRETVLQGKTQKRGPSQLRTSRGAALSDPPSNNFAAVVINMELGLIAKKNPKPKPKH